MCLMLDLTEYNFQLVNSTKYTLIFRQENAKGDILILAPNDRIPLVWADSQKRRDFNVMASDD